MAYIKIVTYYLLLTLLSVLIAGLWSGLAGEPTGAYIVVGFFTAASTVIPSFNLWLIRKLNSLCKAEKMEELDRFFGFNVFMICTTGGFCAYTFFIESNDYGPFIWLRVFAVISFLSIANLIAILLKIRTLTRDI